MGGYVLRLSNGHHNFTHVIFALNFPDLALFQKNDWLNDYFIFMNKEFERNWYLNFESRSHNPFKGRLFIFTSRGSEKNKLPGYKGLVFVYSKRLWRWQKVIIKTNNHLTLSIWRLRRHFRFCKGSMDGGLTWETFITQQRIEDLRKQITKQTENNKTTHYSTRIICFFWLILNLPSLKLTVRTWNWMIGIR